MTDIVKFRIENYKEIESRLALLGAEFTVEINATDTYFVQPADQVLKIADEGKRGTFLVHLRAVKDKFEIIEYTKLKNPKKTKKELEKKLGIHSVLEKQRRFYFDFGSRVAYVTRIKDLGDFLVIIGEKLVPTVLQKKLKLKPHAIVRQSFATLAAAKIEQKKK